MKELSSTEIISGCQLTCPSVYMYQCACHWTNSRKIWYLCLSGKLMEKFQILLKLGEIKGPGVA